MSDDTEFLVVIGLLGLFFVCCIALVVYLSIWTLDKSAFSFWSEHETRMPLKSIIKGSAAFQLPSREGN